jgi:endonuclease-3 related protein
MKPDLIAVYRSLQEKYGYRNWWPLVRGGKSVYLEEFRLRDRTAGEVFEIMAGALLTQNTNWGNAVTAIGRLKENKWLTVKVLDKIPAGKIAAAVKPSGYYRQKAKKLKSLARFIMEDGGGNVLFLKDLPLSEAREKLLGVWGIGPETADSILLYGYGFPVFVVDAYTKRIFSRLGFFDKTHAYETVRKYFEDRLVRDRELFMEYHALLVELGKSACKNSPVCGECVLNMFCPSRV